MHVTFCSWKMFHINYFFREFNLYRFMSLRNFLYFYLFFMKLVGRKFLSSWNLYIDFSSDLVQGIWCLLIFAHGTCCLLILFVKVATFWVFRRETCKLFFLFVKLICSYNLWFSLRETCKLIFFLRETDFSMKRVACWFLFVKLLSCWSFSPWISTWLFSSWNWICSWSHFCSWNLMHIGFPLHETCTLIFILSKLIFSIELVAFCFSFTELVA